MLGGLCRNENHHQLLIRMAVFGSGSVRSRQKEVSRVTHKKKNNELGGRLENPPDMTMGDAMMESKGFFVMEQIKGAPPFTLYHD